MACQWQIVQFLTRKIKGYNDFQSDNTSICTKIEELNYIFEKLQYHICETI